jgi:hypothetical protein
MKAFFGLGFALNAESFTHSSIADMLGAFEVLLACSSAELNTCPAIGRCYFRRGNSASSQVACDC